MAKTKISEFDIDPANNTDINSINIAEGCAPSGINNAIRQLMSDLKEFQTGAGGDSITATGVYSDTIGEKTSAAGVTVDGVLIKDNAVTASGGFSGALNGAVGGTTPAAGAFTTLSASGAFSANGGATLGDASGDALTINSSAVSIPNGLNFDSDTFVIDATNNRVGIGTASPSSIFDARGIGSFGRTSAGAAIQVANFQNFDSSTNSATEIVFNNTTTFNANQFNKIGFVRVNSPSAGDTDMYINLQSAGNTAQRLYLNSSGNLGLGVTPSAWSLSGGKVFQSTAGAIYNYSTSSIAMIQNSYFDGTNFKYISSSLATYYNQALGKHEWYVAPSGTAGTTATFTQAMTLNASGNLSVGTTSTAGKITVAVADNASFQTAANFTNATNADFNIRLKTSVTDIGSSTATPLTFSNGSTERMRIDSSGNVGIGTSSPSYKLDIKTSSGTETYTVIGDHLDRVKIGYSANTGITNNLLPVQVLTDNTGNLLLSTRGTNASNLIMYTSSGSTATERMRIDSSGNLGLGVTPSAWGSNFKVLQVGSQDPAIMIGRTDGPSWAAWGVNFYNDNSNWRYINSDYASFYNIYADGHYWYSAPSGSAGAAFSPTQVLAVVKEQSLALQGASSQTGTGITFPATQNASSNANTLDDYEEGTWTPTAVSQTGSITAYTSSGTYTKIGNVVTVMAYVSLTTVGTAGGQLTITNLPFTSNYSTGYIQPATVSRESQATGNIYFVQQAGGAISASIQNSTNGGIAWANTYKYSFVLTYQTS